MNKIGLVAKHEFVSTLKRRSALFAIFGLPILTLLIMTGINWLNRSQGSDGGSLLSELVTDNEAKLPAGLVDDTGKLQQFSPPADTMFVLFPDLETARAAYDAAEISSYYHIPADYLATGQIVQYAADIPLESFESRILYGLLVENFVDVNVPIHLIAAPLQQFEEIDLSTNEERTQQDYIDNLVLALGVAVLFYLTVMGAAGYLLQSLGKEKENRVMEILLSSIRPLQLLTGKVLGLGGIGLLQMAVWTVLALFVFRGSNSPLSNLTLPALSVGTWALVISHFVIGYLVYASLFAGLGAMAPSVKESSQYTFLLMLPTLLPMWFNSIMINAPNGTFATTLSLFPLTAPITMPIRLAMTTIPVWQWLVSLAGSLVTAVFLLWAATKFFRSKTLLAGQSLSLRLVWQTLRGV
ncbi:MAG: ABC transporter permease [Ardenticatenaceae bacterium]|nr:ABC transporter permease [Ardenticatenaceae bacterium]MCB9443076.1 ABC transporter permease [Ardenticatenaceae bacterium]